MVIWWYGLIWYVLRSPLRPLARPCIFDASISCSQNPISPEDVIERTGFLIHPPVVKLFWDFMFKRTPGYFMSTSCHFADLEYCTTKDAKGKAIAFQITTRNTVCCSSIGLQVFSCSTRFSVQQNVARLVLLSTAYRWVMTRCDRNSAQGRVCGFFRTCTAAKPTNLIGKWRSLCLFRMFEPNFGHTHTQKQTNCP